MNKKLAGYGMDECNAKREVAHAKNSYFVYSRLERHLCTYAYVQ